MVVTPLYGALLVLWFLVLTVRVLQNRRSAKVSLGDGGNTLLQRAIRGHANFAEYVPLALLLLAILELSRFSIYLLHAIGILLLVAPFFTATRSRSGRNSVSAASGARRSLLPCSPSKRSSAFTRRTAATGFGS